MVSLQNTGLLITQNFSIGEGITIAKPLGLFILLLGIYSWFIFKFYKFLARREIFKIKVIKNKSFSSGLKNIYFGFLYILKYIIVYPVFLLFWTVILAVILLFLSKNNSIETTLLISVALVGVVRVMAYYDEDLSKDLAKMMPFALLGVFLVDISFFSVDESLAAILTLPLFWKLFAYYLFIIILIEFILRFIYMVFKLLTLNKKKEGEIKTDHEESNNKS